jgi:hypothetical protein
MTDKDYEQKYITFLPDAGDGAAAREMKTKILQRMIEAKRQGRVKAFDKAGFDVGPWLKELEKATGTTQAKAARLRWIEQQLQGDN